VVIIRPAGVYGQGTAGPVLLAALRYARDHGEALVAGAGSNLIPVVHVDDLAAAYALALIRGPWRNGVERRRLERHGTRSRPRNQLRRGSRRRGRGSRTGRHRFRAWSVGRSVHVGSPTLQVRDDAASRLGTQSTLTPLRVALRHTQVTTGWSGHFTTSRPVPDRNELAMGS
jgi:nucleoside-diphosphate-sugar epimerase